MLGVAEQDFNSSKRGDKWNNQNRILVAAREKAREWTGKIITISSAIIAFSVSIVSVDDLQSSLKVETLQNSWTLLLVAVILGAFNLLFESRVIYSQQWREANLSLDSIRIDNIPQVSYSIACAFMFLSIFYPVSLFEFRNNIMLQAANLLVTNWLRKLYGIVFLVEILTLLFFALGLWQLIMAFQN